MRTPRRGVIALAATATASFLLDNTHAFISYEGLMGKLTNHQLPTNNIGIEPRILEQHAIFANELADVARKEILPYWRQNRAALGQQIKIETDRSVFQSASPVTLADRAAECAMRDLITEKYPDHGIYGEEYGIKDADADWVWVLDPIDGTRSFITGKPLFGTLISLLYKGTPVVGIIDQCILNERWLGIAGKESTLNGKVIQTDGVLTLQEAEMYSTTPDMFQHGHEMNKFDAMRKAVRTVSRKLVLLFFTCSSYLY